MSIVILKYLILAVCIILLHRWRYPVINSKVKVKCPEVKVSLIYQDYNLHQIILTCGKQMLKCGYSEQDIRVFIEEILKCKTKAEIEKTLISYFYIY